MRTQVVHSLAAAVENSQIKSIVHVAKTRCAFINFRDRKSAERAAETWANGLDFDGDRINVKWGRSRPTKTSAADSSSTAEAPMPVDS